MRTYILVHGAWHGGWCWNKVATLLKRKGHKVLTPTLPGHERENPILPGKIAFKDYTNEICKLIDKESEPVFLLGHSMGGAIISQTAEYRCRKIRKLIYLAGFLLRNGESLATVGKADEESMLFLNTIVSKDNSQVRVKMDMVREIFFGDCTDADVECSKALLTNQPASPLFTPLRITPENFGKVPRVYISCTLDRAISPSAQKIMYTNSPCEKIINMNTSHSPFLSAPGELSDYLLSLD